MVTKGRRLMPGNSQRRGAVRNPGSKKGATVGSGGRRAKGLEGKKPTPKATERTKHPAARRARASEKRADPAKQPSARPASRSRSKAAKSGPEYVVGRNAVLEALNEGVPATAMYVATRIDNDDRVREALQVAADRNVPLIETTKTEIDRLTYGANHQGVALQVPAYDYLHPDDLLSNRNGSDGDPLVVVLDHVTDPRNLGAIARSVAAFGGDGIVIADRRSAGVTAGAWKSSAGALSRVAVARTPNIARQVAAFQKAGLFVIGLDAAADVEIADVDASGPLVLVIGAEGEGLSRLVRESCDVTARIQMVRGNESLNAGVAAGIALYAMRTTRGQSR
jgi:23S rRNA (guanosine2251-2'-O)-methyltransferase